MQLAYSTVSSNRAKMCKEPLEVCEVNENEYIEIVLSCYINFHLFVLKNLYLKKKCIYFV